MSAIYQPLIFTRGGNAHSPVPCIVFFLFGRFSLILRGWFTGSGTIMITHDDVMKWEHFSAKLALCAGNSPDPVNSPRKRPVTRSFDVFFDLRLNKRLSEHSKRQWFERSSRSYDVTVMWYIDHTYPTTRDSIAVRNKAKQSCLNIVGYIISLGYLCNIRVEPITNCNSNETYVILFKIYSCITY